MVTGAKIESKYFLTCKHNTYYVELVKYTLKSTCSYAVVVIRNVLLVGGPRTFHKKGVC